MCWRRRDIRTKVDLGKGSAAFMIVISKVCGVNGHVSPPNAHDLRRMTVVSLNARCPGKSGKESGRKGSIGGAERWRGKSFWSGVEEKIEGSKPNTGTINTETAVKKPTGSLTACSCAQINNKLLCLEEDVNTGKPERCIPFQE